MAAFTMEEPMTDLTKFRFTPVFSRRIPDPNFSKSHGIERHLLTMRVSDVPKELPLDPNARTPNPNRRVYREVKESLYNRSPGEPDTFHLKNKGITIVAQSVDKVGQEEFDVHVRQGVHGIVDGGHTYTLISDALGDTDLPPDQFVNVEIRVGVPDSWITEIAGGLNTSVQVQDMSLDNLAGKFDWLKDMLQDEPYFGKIAWSENDRGEFDARDIISFLMAFNIELYPNDEDEHPVHAYEKKSIALKEFERKPGSFERMRPIIKEVLALHDYIRLESRDLWNNHVGSRAAGLAFMETRDRQPFDFPFIGKQSKVRVMNGALFPMLAAFRWYVQRDPETDEMAWNGGFENVLGAWRSVGPELLKATHQASNELGRNPNAIGKSRNHWANLHTRVAKHDLMAQRQAVS